jgi:tetratricopeptide (TPR) repeat protein
VAALEGGDVRHVLQLCDNLADRDLIRPTEGDRYAFRHILIQEVAYGTLPRAERARLHAQAARWGETIGEGREVALAEILAFHYREAAVLFTALQPGAEETEHTRENAATWLLKAADVAAAAGATPEAVRHIRASFDFVEARLKPRLHERIGDMTAGDVGMEDYRQALTQYEEQGAPADDRLRALAGILLVAMRWVGSVGDRPSEDYIAGLRAKGRELLPQAQDRYSIARFLAADAFFPFWVQGVRDPTPEELTLADTNAEQARKMAIELGDADLESAALDASGGSSQAVSDWAKTRETAFQRIKFESSLGFYERLDAHSMAAWMSYCLGDLEAADRASADMAARLLPGQAPYPALHLFAWRALTLDMLGRWDEAVAVFWRAIEAWHDAGAHAAGYALRGFSVGIDIGRARGDMRLQGVAADAMESILARFPADHINRAWTAFIRGDARAAAADPLLTTRYPPESAERQIAMTTDAREQLSEEFIAEAMARSLRQRVPLLQAQVLRARGLARSDAQDMTAAIEIWERSGSQPQLGRARAERGLITGDAAETQAGLALLKKLGDLNYVDRFAARV